MEIHRKDGLREIVKSDDKGNNMNVSNINRKTQTDRGGQPYIRSVLVCSVDRKDRRSRGPGSYHGPGTINKLYRNILF